MKVSKSLKPLFLFLFPHLIATYSVFMGLTTKLRIVAPEGSGRDTREGVFNQPDGVIYCTWHSRFAYFSFFGRGKKVYTMISASRDGELITRTIRHVRLYSVRGSSSRRGKEALQEACEVVKRNGKLFMLPDGPRGPIHTVKPGVIRIAQKTGRAILPISLSSTKGLFIGTWDYFFLPLPFGEAVLTIGDPIYVDKDVTSEEFEQKQLELQNSLNRLREQADLLCNRSPEKEVVFVRKKKRKKKKKTV